jgi:hypothetical protein
LKISAGIFYMPQSWDMGHTNLLPLRRKAYCGFFGCPGLNPRNRVPVASMLTTRPPKPSTFTFTEFGYNDVRTEFFYVIWNNLISNAARVSLQCAENDSPVPGIIKYYHTDNRMINRSIKCLCCLRV